MSVLLNQGNGTFAAPLPYALGNQPVSITAGDLNGDGMPDLAVVDLAGDTVSVLFFACLP